MGNFLNIKQKQRSSSPPLSFPFLNNSVLRPSGRGPYAEEKGEPQWPRVGCQSSNRERDNLLWCQSPRRERKLSAVMGGGLSTVY